MKRALVEFGSGWDVLLENRRAQAAVMTLSPGARTGGPGNRHPDSDQWLFVVSGTGTAIVAGTEQRLEPGILLLIERGEAHEIRNTGAAPLESLNLYVPPEY